MYRPPNATLAADILSMSEPEIQKLENAFPAVSGSAFAGARKRVLASGQSVLLSDNGVIYEVSPDGSRKVFKEIEPPIPVVAGSTYTIR